MATRNTFVTVTDGDQLNQGYFNGIKAGVTWRTMYNPKESNTDVNGVMGHSSTTWSVQISNGEIKQTSDTGASWTSRNTDLDIRCFFEMCRADKTHGVAIEDGATTQECAFTDDSGATWTTKTSLAFATDIFDVSFSTAGLIVVGGNDGGGGKHIVFSTDDGGTWTDATTPPSAAVVAVDMFSATVGYAVDTSGNIWKTTDGADTWIDTTDNVSGVIKENLNLIAATADIVLINADNTGQKYVNSTNTVTTLFALSDRGCFFKSGDGYTYLYSGIAGNTTVDIIRSNDNWSTFQVLPLGSIAFGFHQTGSTSKRGSISEAGDGSLLISDYRSSFILLDQS